MGSTCLGGYEWMAVFKCLVTDWESVLLELACYAEFPCVSGRVLLV